MATFTALHSCRSRAVTPMMALALVFVLAASAQPAVSAASPTLQASQHQVLRELVRQWGKFKGYRSWNFTTPRACNLYAGVKCGPVGYIANIALPSANINGPVGSLSRLKTLQFLNLADNKISAIAALSALTSLVYLDLSGVVLSLPQFPPQLSTLVNLRHLDVSGCFFFGNLPPFISTFTQLTHLELSFNPFEGPIPTGYGRLINLEFLAINGTEFPDREGVSGSIPRSLSALKRLKHLELNNNGLTGPIPPFVATLSNLTYLRLAHNRFDKGPIPAGFTNLLKLHSLDLLYTFRTGGIPAAIGRLSKLTSLILTANAFQGRIPSTFNNLVNLEYVSFGGNYLVGPVPEIKRLTKLTGMNVANNILTGRFPPFIPPSLKTLDTSNNYFYGIATLYYPNRTQACLGDAYRSDANCLTFPPGFRPPCGTVRYQKTALECRQFCRTLKAKGTQCDGNGICIPRSINTTNGAVGNFTCVAN